MSKYFVYLPDSPIDNFDACYTLPEFLKSFDIPNPIGQPTFIVHKAEIIVNSNPLYEILGLYREALREANFAGFQQHDCREVYVFSIPGENFSCLPGFIFKENQNGTTYIVSPYPLQHLAKFEVK